MEKFPKNHPERKSGIVRVVGLEKGREQEALEAAGEVFSKKQELVKGEKEKTPEQKAVIAFINSKLPLFLEHYGGQPLFISEDKIHLAPKKFFGRRKNLEAKYSADDQGIFMDAEENLPLLGFTKVAVHEIFHFNSFQSIQVGQDSQESLELKLQGPRRMGFQIANPILGVSYFQHIDEAVIEELTMRFSEQFLKQCPELKKEIAQLKVLIQKAPENDKKHPEEFSYSVVIQKDGEWEAQLIPYHYQGERRELNELIDEIYEKNKKEFKSREEVFDLFVKATMAGRLLPIARLIEKTFGKGSFREIGEERDL